MSKIVAMYWIYKQTGGKDKKWNTMYHNGVVFSPLYKPLNINIIYDGKSVSLPPLAEEYAVIYTKYRDSEYIKNPRFNKNFWKDWKKLLDKDTIIQSLSKCDFSPLYDKYKTEKMEIQEKYKIAQIDGKEQKIANYLIEPTGIFIGRGNNKNIGKIKRRIMPEDITLNLSKDAPIPKMQKGYEKHKWGKIINDMNVEWLASWKDEITGKTKYVWLNAHSDLKARSDIAKFDLARKLKTKIKTIRRENEKYINSENMKEKQIGTAIYFIDNLALRVGNETSDEGCADTVGVTSLRCEHVTLLGHNKIKLNFLGKDSIRYNNTVDVNKNIYNNVEIFMSNKKKTDELFDLINSTDINKYLQTFMKGLTAKVFRTYNATNLFEQELKKLDKKFDTYTDDDKQSLLLEGFNKANAKVAVLCNHQKCISKTHSTQIELLNDKIKNIRIKIKKSKNDRTREKYNKKLVLLKAKKIIKMETKNISLGTSKINYIDPRVTAKFIKKHNLPIEKIFSKTLIEKFKWAFDDDKN